MIADPFLLWYFLWQIAGSPFNCLAGPFDSRQLVRYRNNAQVWFIRANVEHAQVWTYRIHSFTRAPRVCKNVRKTGNIAILSSSGRSFNGQHLVVTSGTMHEQDMNDDVVGAGEHDFGQFLSKYILDIAWIIMENA